ncbi:hypothetical protein ABPG75_010690 [Micractinium tetrahymenae]
MFFLPLYFSLGVALTILAGAIGSMCFARKARQEQEKRVEELQQLAERAYAAAEGGAPLPPAPRRRRRVPMPAAAVLPPGGDGLRAPLLQAIQEGPEDEEEEEEAGSAPPPVQTLEELPACVRAFLGRAVRDGRNFKLFTLRQLGQMKLEPRGSWKEAEAVQRACPLEPAFVWSATASLAPLISVKGFDSFVGGHGRCAWRVWGALPAAAGEGPEVDQSLLVRWLAEAACFPQALQPSSFLRWEPVPGEGTAAVVVLSYAGLTVRATFGFDRFARIVRLTSRDFLRRLPSGRFERGEWVVSYSGHMLFGLSPQGDVMQEEVATHAGVFVPTNVEAAWRLPDGSLWHYAKFTVAKVTAE